MISMIEARNDILHKIVGGYRSQSAVHISVNKKLMIDIANQSNMSHAIMSADASNYFDRVTHPISAIIY